MPESSERRKVVITGAGRGICAAMARHLLEGGYEVAILDLEPRFSWGEISNEHLIFLRCDVRNQDQIRMSVEHIMGVWGGIDILVNGAAVAVYEPSKGRDVLDKEMEVNLKGAVNMMNAVIPIMMSQGVGKIHNLGSILFQAGNGRMAGYISSKAALAACSGALRRELQGTGVHVNMFYPPLTLTSLTVGSGMPEGIMADPERVGRNLARKIERVDSEVFSDLATMAQALLIRLFPTLISRFIDKVLWRKQFSSIPSIESVDGRWIR